MAKNYAIYEFGYIYDDNDINILTGSDEETDDLPVACFDGIALVKSLGKFYKMEYPKMSDLTEEDENAIYDYCGYYPHEGEFGAVAVTFAEIHEISAEEYADLLKAYPVEESDKDLFGWMESLDIESRE